MANTDEAAPAAPTRGIATSEFTLGALAGGSIYMIIEKVGSEATLGSGIAAGGACLAMGMGACAYAWFRYKTKNGKSDSSVAEPAKSKLKSKARAS